MKKISLLIIAIITAITLTAQNGAHIQFKITSAKGMNGTMDMKFSEFGTVTEMKMLAPQLPGGEMKSKSLSKKSNPDVFYVIDDVNKTYREQKKSAARPVKDEKEITVKKLGEETVNGYKCVHALITEGTTTSEVWNTKDFADYEKYNAAFDENKSNVGGKRQKALKAAGCEGFSVKMIRKGNDKDPGMTMELVKFEKKTFTAADFELPTGYTKTENSAGAYPGAPGSKGVGSMTAEERAKYIEEMKKKYGK